MLIYCDASSLGSLILSLIIFLFSENYAPVTPPFVVFEDHIKTLLDIIGYEWVEVLEELDSGLSSAVCQLFFTQSHCLISGVCTVEFCGIAWSSLDRLKDAMLYPEVFSFDTTFKTNQQNYPFAMITGMNFMDTFGSIRKDISITLLTGSNADRKACNWVSALLLDEKQLSFHWLLLTALPVFLGEVLEVQLKVFSVKKTLPLISFLLSMRGY